MSDSEFKTWEINIVNECCEEVNSTYVVALDPASNWWLAIDWYGNQRAVFQEKATAWAWCETAYTVFDAMIPETNAEIKQFHNLMFENGWRIGRYFKGGFEWELKSVTPQSLKTLYDHGMFLCSSKDYSIFSDDEDVQTLIWACHFEAIVGQLDFKDFLRSVLEGLTRINGLSDNCGEAQ